MPGRACRWIALVALAASCGRLDFERTIDAAGSAAIDAPIALVPTFVAMAGMATGDGATVATVLLPIQEVTAGDLLIVAVADHHGNTVASVVDGSGNSLTSAGARAVMTSTATELWYEAPSVATNSVTVTLTPASNFDVWAYEFSGTKPGPPETIATNCLQYPPTIVTAPGMTTSGNELVFSVAMLAFPLFASDVIAPFTGNVSTGNAASFYVAPVPGSYGTMFDIASGQGMTAMTCASTAVWLPGP